MGSMDGPNDGGTSGSSVIPPPPPGFIPANQAPPPPPGFVPAGGQAQPARQETAAQMFARKDIAEAQQERQATQTESESFHNNLNELMEAAHDIRAGNVAKGAHRALAAVGSLLAPAAITALPVALVSAPLATVGGLAGGVAGQKIGEAGATAMGATPEQAALTGDITGAIGGGLGTKGGSAASQAIWGEGGQAGARRAYQTALKPPPSGSPAKVAQAQRAVETGLKEGIPVSKGGLQKLYDLIDDLNEKVSDVIKAHPEREISPKAVAGRLAGTEQTFGEQVNPQEDIAAIKQTGKNYLAKHTEQRPYTPIRYMQDEAGNTIAMPGPPGSVPAITPTPALGAQAEKVGTYRQLKGKYGELKSAQVEAEKALARGIKEELDAQFPEARALNQRESAMLDLEPLLNRAIQRISNHQIFGIGTPIMAGGVKAVTGSNKAAAVAGLMKAVLDSPGIKSRLAIAMYRHGITPGVIDSRLAAFASGLASAAATSTQGENQPTNQQPSPQTTPANQ